jgi:hypothetical protein
MEMVSLKMGELNKFSKTMIYYYKIFDHVCYPSLLFILFVLNPHIWKLWYRSINKCLNCESETGSTNNLPLYEHESFFISRNINLIKSRRAIKSLIDTFKRRTKLGRVVEETNSEVSIIRSADGSTGTTLTDSTTPSSQNSLISNNSADAELNNEFSAQQRNTEPSSSAGGRPSSRKSSKSFLTITLDKNNKIQNYNHSTNDDASSGGGGGGVDPTLSDRAIATAISELPWEDYQGLFNNGSSTGGGYTGGGDASNKPKKLPPLNIQASFDSQRLNASFDEQSINSSTTNNSLDLDHFNSEMMNQSTDILKAVL